MASNSKKTKAIRSRKRRPNKENMKKDHKRIQRNNELLRELASETGS
jgi:hypothetical protein